MGTAINRDYDFPRTRFLIGSRPQKKKQGTVFRGPPAGMTGGGVFSVTPAATPDRTGPMAGGAFQTVFLLWGQPISKNPVHCTGRGPEVGGRAGAKAKGRLGHGAPGRWQRASKVAGFHRGTGKPTSCFLATSRRKGVISFHAGDFYVPATLSLVFEGCNFGGDHL